MNLKLALLCGDTYYFQRNFDHWFDGSTTSGVCFGIKIIEKNIFIAFEGSHDTRDWIRNFDVAIADHPILGMINSGQAIGIPGVLDVILGMVKPGYSIYVTGHSRGAAYAIYIGALLMQASSDVYVAAFEPPRTMHNSCNKLADIYKGKSLLITKNLDDIVPDMPLNYLHPGDVTPTNYQPVSFDVGLEFRFHHIQLIISYFAKKEQGL